MTEPLFDGTFSTEAVAGAGLALVEQLYAEAMASIAALAENWDSPAEEAPAVTDEPVAFVEPASWSAEDDEDDVHVLGSLELPALLLRPRRAAGATAVAA